MSARVVEVYVRQDERERVDLDEVPHWVAENEHGQVCAWRYLECRDYGGHRIQEPRTADLLAYGIGAPRGHHQIPCQVVPRRKVAVLTRVGGTELLPRYRVRRCEEVQS